MAASLVAAYERATGVPAWRRSGFLLAVSSGGYLVVAGVVAFFLLPSGFGLSGAGLVLGQTVAILVGAGLVVLAVGAVSRGVRSRAALWATAAALGWEYRADVSDRIWGGSIDEQTERRGRTSLDYVAVPQTGEGEGGRVLFDSALRTFVVGEGQGAAVHQTRAVRIALPAAAPRIQIRSRRGGGALSALARRASPRRELTLEGGFSDVFVVSTPAGYEQDALYVLTPDLMAVLLDNAASLDLEIVDDTLHVYFPVVQLGRPDELVRFVDAVFLLRERIGRRVMRYRDDGAPLPEEHGYRRPGDALSASARRLDTRGRVAPVAWAVLGAFVPLLIGVVWTALAG